MGGIINKECTIQLLKAAHILYFPQGASSVKDLPKNPFCLHPISPICSPQARLPEEEKLCCSSVTVLPTG